MHSCHPPPSSSFQNSQSLSLSGLHVSSCYPSPNELPAIEGRQWQDLTLWVINSLKTFERRLATWSWNTKEVNNWSKKLWSRRLNHVSDRQDSSKRWSVFGSGGGTRLLGWQQPTSRYDPPTLPRIRSSALTQSSAYLPAPEGWERLTSQQYKTCTNLLNTTMLHSLKRPGWP